MSKEPLKKAYFLLEYANQIFVDQCDHKTDKRAVNAMVQDFWKLLREFESSKEFNSSLSPEDQTEVVDAVDDYTIDLYTKETEK